MNPIDWQGMSVAGLLQKRVSFPHTADLSWLGEKYGTDKAKHGYTTLYQERLLPRRMAVRRVLELGVFFGSSLQMWRDFFPNAVVHGLDTFKGVDGWSNVWGDGRRTTFSNPARFLRAWERGEHPRITLHVRNQSDDASMLSFVGQLKGLELFDLIVDDGSHLNHDQQVNLAQFLPLLAAGGLYIVEDLHCSLQSGYDDPKGGVHTTLKTLMRFNRTHQMRSRHLTPQQSKDVESRVVSVELIRTRRGSWTSLCFT